MISRSRPGAPRLPGESSQVLPLLQKRGNSLAQLVGATTFILGVARPRCGLGLTRSPPGLRVPGQELTPRNARGGCDGHGHPLEPNPRTPRHHRGAMLGSGPERHLRTQPACTSLWQAARRALFIFPGKNQAGRLQMPGLKRECSSCSAPCASPSSPPCPKYPGLFTVGPWLGALGALPALVQIAEPLGEQESLGALVAAW